MNNKRGNPFSVGPGVRPQPRNQNTNDDTKKSSQADSFLKSLASKPADVSKHEGIAKKENELPTFTQPDATTPGKALDLVMGTLLQQIEELSRRVADLERQLEDTE